MTEKKTTTVDTGKEQVIQDERRITWSYQRKKNIGNFQSEDIGIYMTDLAPKSTKNMVKWVADHSEAVFDELKPQVWAALDLEFEFSELGRPVLVEKAAPPTPTPTPAQAPQQQAQPQAAPPAQAPRAPGQTPSVAQQFVHAVTPTFCRDCGAQGLEAFYDNRVQNDEKQAAGQKIGPDFKCRTCEGGNGPNKQGRPTPIYRPGSYEYNQKVGAPTQAAPMAPPAQQEPYGTDETPF